MRFVSSTIFATIVFHLLLNSKTKSRKNAIYSFSKTFISKFGNKFMNAILLLCMRIKNYSTELITKSTTKIMSASIIKEKISFYFIFVFVFVVHSLIFILHFLPFSLNPSIHFIGCLLLLSFGVNFLIKNNISSN